MVKEFVFRVKVVICVVIRVIIQYAIIDFVVTEGGTKGGGVYMCMVYPLCGCQCGLVVQKVGYMSQMFGPIVM